ncbi:family 10 glycosylhydrolase [Anaerotignum sp. MB30-C6]|uniref:family 10 glycosylhydrolase n=1 Tax=Anaerotignum sp. MB30-C6 TaxID=3070814 RepID=UPI0027DC03E1|nr:family 10 glycosylhydrolase [Anaerotignum sp. MB30-C6]WMI81977.1 family 10 glycosylhydrolase [Anaerotignum sp. MB30-C6]
MKKWLKKIGAAIVTASIVLSSTSMATAYAADSKDFCGVWISTVYSADYPSVQNDIAKQKAEFSQKLDKLKAVGVNAVMVQVRPKGDAFYKSELNPWSAVLTGVQGKDPGYDPMKFMIEEAHKRDMEFHAWMNPYRITTSGTDLAALSADNMARKNPDWILTYKGAMYYNPAKTEVKEYIRDTVGEIVKKYDVDAIHFDDYFYPSNYPLPEGEKRDGKEGNARREHINDMVRMVSQEIKSVKADVAFGISPLGIWKNNSSDPSGSATNGGEGYYSVFGDAKTWVEKGWIDYIAPQLYWERGNTYADYETLVKWWSNMVKGTGVTLYIGQGLYKDVVAKEITEQLKINEGYNVEGSIFFSARDIFDDRQGAATALKKYYSAPEPSVTEPGTTTVIEKKRAYATSSAIKVNGAPVSFEVYTIDDYTYFKLRDIAYSISGTAKEFDTVWNGENSSINLLTGLSYSGTPGGNAIGKDTTAVTSTAKLYLDGDSKNVSAFTINDYTYYKLRDIAKLLDVGVTWDEGTSTIGIDTTTGYK